MNTPPSIDTATIVWRLVVTIFFVLLNGFFVAAEFALVKVRPTRIRALAERLAAVMAAVVEVGFERMDRRLARFLLEAPRATAHGAVELSHEQVARELGTAREVVTRILDSFVARGLVSLGRHRISLSNTPDLYELARGHGEESESPR